MSNHCSLIVLGRLTRDPDLRQTGNGTDVCNIGIAWNRRIKKGGEWVDEPVFLTGVIWGARGAAFSRHHAKGDQVFLTGELELNRWEDQGGNERKDLRMNVAEWEFVGAKGGDPQDDRGDDPF